MVEHHERLGSILRLEPANLTVRTASLTEDSLEPPSRIGNALLEIQRAENKTCNHLPAMNDHGSRHWAIGAAVGLSLLPCGLFVVASVYLLSGGGLGPGSAWAILMPVAAGVLFLAYRTGGDWKSPATVVAVTLLAAAASHIVIDTSYDGQEYHYDATRALADGWNPYKEAYQPPAELRGYVPPSLWPRHYPQAAWLAAAVPIAAGIDMETAKLAPLLLMAAIFVGVFGAATTWRLDWKRSLGLALLTSANPVIIVQLFTRMNDGQLGACFILAALFTALWLRRPRASLALAACGAMAYGLNLKFSAIPIFMLLSVLITLVTFASQGRYAALKVSAGLFGVGIVSVLILGAHPYVTNTLRHSHPFYPIMGQGAVDIMTSRPAVLSEKGTIQRLIESYFSVTSTAFSWTTMGYDDKPGLKLPFTFRPGEEFWASGVPDARLAGFGPLFSGAVLLAAGLGGWIAAGNATRPRYIALTAALGLAFVSLSMPEAWWARYVPQFWWAPAIVAAVAVLSEQFRVRILGWALVVIMLFNSAIVSTATMKFAGRRAQDVRRQVAEITGGKENICIFLGPTHARLELLHAVGVRTKLHSAPLSAECHPSPLASSYRINGEEPNYCTCI